MSWLGARRRRTMVSVGVAAAVVVLMAGHANAATGTGAYFQSTGTGATFAVLHTNNLVKGRVDDAVFGLSTTGTGLHHLPFALHLYNQTYRNVVVSSNGNIQVGVTPAQATRTFANTCLPSAAFAQAAVLPYWDDLVFDSSDTTNGFPQGIVLRTAGTAPHRTSYVYGTFGGASATIGIQAKQQLSRTQFSCDAGLPDPLEPTMTITLQHTNVA